jgi:methylated-DNA-[protein]-cysteine S-methyltransferase
MTALFHGSFTPLLLVNIAKPSHTHFIKPFCCLRLAHSTILTSDLARTGKMAVTEFQEVRKSLIPHSSRSFPKSSLQNRPPFPPNTNHAQRVYTLLTQIPRGRLTSYLSLSRALHTSPRAIGGALRNNPFAPEVPCHRVIAANGFVGGFKGDWEKAPSGINQSRKLELLRDEGVEFDERGMLVDQRRWWDGEWKFGTKGGREGGGGDKEPA